MQDHQGHTHRQVQRLRTDHVAGCAGRWAQAGPEGRGLSQTAGGAEVRAGEGTGGICGPGQAADRSRVCSSGDSDSRVNWPPRQRHGHLSPSTHRPPWESIPRTLGPCRESTQSPLCSLRKVCETGLNSLGFASRDFCAGHLRNHSQGTRAQEVLGGASGLGAGDGEPAGARRTLASHQKPPGDWAPLFDGSQQRLNAF